MKLLLLVTLLTAGATAHSISHQTAQRFGTAFDCYSKSNISTMNIHPWPVSKIFGFMCHTPNFSPHVDDIARCCERHDRCYEEAKKLGGCTISEDNRYDIPYYYSCSGRELICSVENNACEAAICNCDRQAAICIFWEVSDTIFKDNGFNTFC
uniref:phospholipase A2-like isoform X1 n=2 Tax=Myodes glareolus TaxID=447135 RepID=UPI0020206E7C|nr:phospholipase A2-like isoform X1 [Myodes glareolus]XP_048279408.1 phospholipase A2-like isoform X1 [Myodes glareolus]XP_048279416.1 phospholipase A2-like isoform X1 [Myodes glareolus]